ncbi:synaptotagmin-like protein 2 isoform 5-T5 [Discoglossus pictus]
MIDLSFLTEAEQEAILKVLSRDAELKKSEEERVRHLQDVVDDENELKYKTGQWFYEAKSKRHRDKIHGADLVRASIRKRKQPSTIAELSKGSLDPSKKSWVNNVKGLFIPPELYGVMEEPEEDLEALQQTKAQANQSAKRVSFLTTDNKENLVNGTASPAKIRKNPFNADLEEIGTDRSQVKENQPPENGTGPNADILPSYIKFGVKLPFPDRKEATQVLRVVKSQSQVPTPKPRTVQLKKNEQSPNDSSNNKTKSLVNGTSVPKGILKRWSSSSSTDSETLWTTQGVDSNKIVLPGSPILEGPALSEEDVEELSGNSQEQLKQVRFSENVQERQLSPCPGTPSGREIGEFRILDTMLYKNDWDKPGVYDHSASEDPMQIKNLSTSLDFDTEEQDFDLNSSQEGQRFSPTSQTISRAISTERKNKNKIESSLDDSKPVMTFPSQNTNSEPEPLYAVVKKIPKQDLPEDKKPEIEVSKPISVDPKQGLEDPVLSALARSAAKAVLKDQLKPDIPKEDIVLSDKEVPTENSLQENAEKLKRLSQSVPAFLDNETDGRDTDSASESSFQIGRHKKSPSSLTNLSGSSGMASLSSVSGSVMSVYSGDFGNVDIKGNIQFAVDYVEQSREFNVFVCQCKDLAVADLKRQRSDPYVKSYLLPDKAKMGKRKSAVKKKTLNPTYNEVLRYKIDKPTLLNQTLNLSVWHNDPLGRNSFLGEVDLVLATWDWDNKEMNWYPLQPRTPSSGIGLENRGETKLALKYIPEMSPGIKLPITGEVHIWIKECNQLPILRGNKINSFIKCTILPDTSRKSRQKTRTVDRTPNPVFNHTMVYDGFKEEDLREACVELTVWDHNRLTNHFLGGLRIGLGTGKSYGTAVDWMDSNIEESTMWEKMINTPNTWIEGVLPLRMLRMAKLIK